MLIAPAVLRNTIGAALVLAAIFTAQSVCAQHRSIADLIYILEDGATYAGYSQGGTEHPEKWVVMSFPEHPPNPCRMEITQDLYWTSGEQLEGRHVLDLSTVRSLQWHHQLRDGMIDRVALFIHAEAEATRTRVTPSNQRRPTQRENVRTVLVEVSQDIAHAHLVVLPAMRDVVALCGGDNKHVTEPFLSESEVAQVIAEHNRAVEQANRRGR